MTPKKEWRNHNGEVVPSKYIPAFDKMKEAAVERLFKKAKKVAAMIEEFKKEADAETMNLYVEMFKLSGIEPGGKGNVTFFNFDKSLKVEISMKEVIDFNDKIVVAQEKINQFLEVKTAGADQDLSLLVNNAFKTSKGRLDKARVFGLFQLKITHPLWVEAMNLIKDSIDTNSTKKYITFYQRQPNNQYKLVQLNWSAL